MPNGQLYFRAMGKVFAETEECGAFFDLLERQLSQPNNEFKLPQIEGLFYLLSLREKAPFAFADRQTILFASKLLDRLEERIEARHGLSRLVNVCLKTYAGLMRYRLVRPDFMTVDDPDLGKRQAQIFERLIRRAQRERNIPIEKLTTSVIEWLEKRGADRTILQWDDAEEE